jgi:hypothetical protein
LNSLVNWKKSLAALFSDISCVAGGKKRGLIYLKLGRLCSAWLRPVH